MRLGLIGCTGHWQAYGAALATLPGLEIGAVCTAAADERLDAFDAAPGVHGGTPRRRLAGGAPGPRRPGRRAGQHPLRPDPRPRPRRPRTPAAGDGGEAHRLHPGRPGGPARPRPQGGRAGGRDALPARDTAGRRRARRRARWRHRDPLARAQPEVLPLGAAPPGGLPLSGHLPRGGALHRDPRLRLAAVDFGRPLRGRGGHGVPPPAPSTRPAPATRRTCRA